MEFTKINQRDTVVLSRAITTWLPNPTPRRKARSRRQK